MTFDADMAAAISAAESEFGTAASWYPLEFPGGEAIPVSGVFNAAAFTKQMADAGFDLGVDATYVCNRAQFATISDKGNPVEGQVMVIDGETFRISGITRDSVSYELQLKKQ